MNNNVLISILISSLAGLSTLIGGVVVFFKFKDRDAFLSFALSFSLSVMICISIFDLIPESFKDLYYYFGSLFNFYNYYFNSSSIISFILSISGKNKFVPCFFNANSELKFSNISSFKLSATLTGAPFIVCG